MEELKDFDNVLQESFDATKFANNLLLMTNEVSTTGTDHEQGGNNTVIDLNTSIKKINFDLNEVNKLYEKNLNQNSTLLINRLYDDKQNNEKISEGLLESLKYVELSYGRLNNEILKPYELSQRLQSALNKIHQTSTLLRDAVLYLHIVNMIKSLTANNTNNNNKTAQSSQEFTMLKLASLYEQLQLTLQKNINLNSLTIVKTLQNDWILNNKRQLIMNLSNTLYQYCSYLNNGGGPQGKSSHEISQLITKFSLSLYSLSQQDFNITINKYIQSLVATNSQLLIKTINNLKDFPSVLSQILSNASPLIILQDILSNVVIDSITQKNLVSIVLLKNYNSSMPIHNFQDIFWSKVSQLFKKELEISFNRGGPVGKNLSKNKSFLDNTMNRILKDDPSLPIMIKALSILSQ